jgi:radical SAM protein with 4Fe4S-binding SPASM domain
MMECSSLVNLGYDTFSERLHAKSRQQRIPMNGSFEVTARCNLRCVHCYLPLSQRVGSRRGELSLVEIDRILSEIAEAGCLWLLLTGGEPFLRQDFLDIYDLAKHKGFITTIFTNGTLITERAADHLAEWRPFSIEISIYGATQATYESVTGIPGSFDRCMRGIELLLERGLPLRLKSVLLTLNQHELVLMKQLSENLGLEFRYDPVISAGIDGSQAPVQYRLAPEQIIFTEIQDPGRAEDWPKVFEEVKGFEIKNRGYFNCGAGRTSFHIDAEGKLCLCLSARTPNFDLHQGSFQEGWDHFLTNQLAMEYSDQFGCLGCDLRMVCMQCPAMGITEFGDPEARVPFLCNLTHLRSEAFNLDKIPQVVK